MLQVESVLDTSSLNQFNMLTSPHSTDFSTLATWSLATMLLLATSVLSQTGFQGTCEQQAVQLHHGLVANGLSPTCNDDHLGSFCFTAGVSAGAHTTCISCVRAFSMYIAADHLYIVLCRVVHASSVIPGCAVTLDELDTVIC